MPAVLIDGRSIAAQIQDELRREAASLRAAGAAPCLAMVLAGDDPASHRYVRGKARVAESLGIETRDHLLPASVSQAHLLALVQSLNQDPQVHGILVQMPLPGGLQAREVLHAVRPEKDVDGLHPLNLGNLLKGSTPMPPCTPAGVLELLRRTGVELRGKRAVVVGRSDLVGKPTAILLLHEHATVTVCHSRTIDLEAECRRAEVLVTAIGRARLITAGHVRPGAVVIDVGQNQENGCLVGDVDFEAVRHLAAAITPVPGGVGPMTVTMLMKNTLAAARMAEERKLGKQETGK
jgi:methylenetetrahydrofolate dehydrogenase (NADP+)/methenyltetrahydrofolate cyclohydrolase